MDLLLILLRKREVKKAQIDYSICDEEECDCKHGILKSTLKHTFMTTLFIFIISLILNIIMHFIGSDVLSKLFLKNSFWFFYYIACRFNSKLWC